VAAGGQAGTPLVVQDDAEQATVDGKPAVVIDEAQLLELVHEMTDAGTGGADHLCQTLLTDSGKDCFGSAFPAKMREQQENSSQPQFARIKELVDKVLFIPDIAGEQMRDE